MKTNSNPISLIQEVQPLIKQIARAEVKTVPKKEITSGVRSNNEKEDKKIDEMLTASLRDMGIVNPLIVVKQADGTYRLITGNRRFNSTQENEVPVRIVNAELSKEVCAILSFLVRMVDTIHNRELSDKESYDAVKNIAEAYQLDATHSFAPMMSLLGLESQNEKYKNLKRIWELYRHSELREVIDSGIAEVKHLKPLKLDLGKMDAFAAALKGEHARWVKAGSLKPTEALDSKTCKQVLSQVQEEEKKNSMPNIEVGFQEDRLVIPAMTIVLTNPKEEDYSKAIQAIFWMQELKETLAAFAQLNRPSDPGGEFQKRAGVVPIVEFSHLAKVVQQHNAYRYVPSKLKLAALRENCGWRQDKVPTAGTELIQFEEAFQNFVEAVSKDESK